MQFKKSFSECAAFRKRHDQEGGRIVEPKTVFDDTEYEQLCITGFFDEDAKTDDNSSIEL